MGAMCVTEYRFDGPAPPCESLTRELQDELGGTVSELEPIEVDGDRVRIASMSAIVLLYGAKVCQRRGGWAVHPYEADPPACVVPIPSWAETPWREHGFFRRLCLGFGEISLERVPRSPRLA